MEQDVKSLHDGTGRHHLTSAEADKGLARRIIDEDGAPLENGHVMLS